MRPGRVLQLHVGREEAAVASLFSSGCDLYIAGASHGEAGATPRCCKPLPWGQRAAEKP